MRSYNVKFIIHIYSHILLLVVAIVADKQTHQIWYFMNANFLAKTNDRFGLGWSN